MYLDLGKSILGYIVIVSLSVLLLSGSGITQEHILYPMSFGMSIIDSSSSSTGIGMSFVLLFIVLFPLSSSLVSVYATRCRNPDFALLIAPLASSILVFVLYGLSVATLLVSLGLVLSVFVLMYLSTKYLDVYKTVNHSRIASKSSSGAFNILSFVLVLVSYLMIPSDASEVASIVSSDITQSISGMVPSNANELVIEGNRQAMYEYLEFTERALINSFQSSTTSDGSLSSGEAKVCSDAFRSKLDEIDSMTKENIDSLFDQELAELGSGISVPDTMLAKIIRLYPLTVMLSVFFILGVVSFLMAKLSGLYAGVLARIFVESPVSAVKPVPQSYGGRYPSENRYYSY